MMHRREFFRHTSLAGAALAIGSWTVAPSRARARPLDFAGDDGAFWRSVEAAFAPAPDFTNLEYGFFCPPPVRVQDIEAREMRRIAARASHFKRNEARDELEATRTELAALAGTSPEEIVLTRNTTESMNIIVQGYPFERGDEVIHSDQDYGSMVQALRHRARRDGIVLKEVKVPLHPQDDNEIVEAFAAAMTPRTRLLHLTHMINLTGQLLPARAIADMAHARGVEVAVDAAHSFAHADFRLPDIGADYLGSSLHKWLCAPVGTGLLYVRREKIEKLWPLMGDVSRDDSDIRKLERMGTRPEQHLIALREAIAFHNEIGSARKAARLRHLHRSWADVLDGETGIILNTPRDPARHGAVGNVGLRGVEPRALADFLMDHHRILTVGIQHPAVQGIRVTPGVPTPDRHISRFVEAMLDARKRL